MQLGSNFRKLCQRTFLAVFLVAPVAAYSAEAVMYFSSVPPQPVNVPAGTSVTVNYVVQNNAPMPFALNIAASPPNATISYPAAASLPGSGAVVIPVTFNAPTTPVTVASTLVVSSGGRYGISAPIQFQSYYTGLNLSFVSKPSYPVLLGVGGAQVVNYQIKNNSTVAVPISVALSPAQNFSISSEGNTCGNAIPVNSVCNLPILLTAPATPQTVQGTLSINYPSAPAPLTDQPEINAVYPLVFAAKPSFPINMPTDGKRIIQYVIQNNLPQAQNITANFSGNQFNPYQTGTTCGATLNGSQTCTLAYAFNGPSQAQTFSGTFNVQSNYPYTLKDSYHINTYAMSGPWQDIPFLNSGKGPIAAITSSADDPDVVYFGENSSSTGEQYSSMYFMRNETAIPMNTGLTSPITTLALSAVNSSLVFGSILFGENSSLNGIYLSNNQVSWTSQSASSASIFSFVTLDALNASILIAGDSTRGIYYSSNGGASFQSVFPGMPIKFVRFVGPNTAFAGGPAVTSTGLYQSTNGGLNWSIANNNLTNKNLTINSISAIDSTHMLIGTNSGVYFTNDSGASWNPVQGSIGNLPCPNPMYVYAADTQTFYAISSYCQNSPIKVFRTTDGGLNWLDLSTGLPASQTLSSFYASSPYKLYIGTHQGHLYQLVGQPPSGAAH